MSRLKGKVAVISGGTSGIGLAIAQRFVNEGAHVFIFGRRQHALDEAVKLIGANVTAIQADASRLEDLDRVADAVRSAKGKVDVVVSNAGVTERSPLPEITPEHYDRVFALNARAPLFLVQKMLPMMGSGGSIILVASAMHYMGLANHSAYAAAKAELRLTKVIRANGSGRPRPGRLREHGADARRVGRGPELNFLQRSIGRST
jgi:NAD(P)-dependent dehydrogenase (short-subunit alcohol dehydrogenase family)